MGQNFLLIFTTSFPRTKLCDSEVFENSHVLSGVGFGAYCAVDFALVMDVLPNDREKAKDLAVWHQVREKTFKHGTKVVFRVTRSHNGSWSD